MQGTILLNHNDDTSKVEEEERSRFLANILDSMGIEIEDIWDEGLVLSIEKKIRLRKLLYSYSVQVIDDAEGGMNVYVDNDLIGSWKKPHYVLKKDNLAIDPRKKLYLEMRINCYSIFENE